MKTKFLKILIPLGLGLILAVFTIWGLVGCEPVCGNGELAGNNGHCYACPAGTTASYSGSGNCSGAVEGVYCCAGAGDGGGGTTGCQPKTGCPLSAPWKGGNSCFATTAACHAAGYSTCRQCN